MDSKKVGGDFGFGLALLIFTSLFYLFFHGPLLGSLSYPVFIVIILIIYLLYLIVRGFK